MDKVELDLDKPIFTFYYNIDGLSRQRAEQEMIMLRENFDIYKNATMWIIACKGQDTKIECIYDGWGRSRNLELSELIKEINKRVDILSNSKNFDDFKMNIREWRLDKIIDGDNEE